MINRRKKIYRAEGKSIRYRILKDQCDIAIAEAKKKYLQKITELALFAKNTKMYYKAINLLKSKEVPVPWYISNLFQAESSLRLSK